ncbi:hypothetical protein S245_010212, partial [Arachis hypogaea]
CDPVMGDEGKLSVPQKLISVYRKRIVPVASMLTPNQFKAKLLTGFRILGFNLKMMAKNLVIFFEVGPSKVYLYICTWKNSYLGCNNKYKYRRESSSRWHP